MRRTPEKIMTFVFLFILISVLISYSAEAENKKSRLIVMGIDFSMSSRAINAENQEINMMKKKKLAYKLRECIRPGDKIFIYQITDKSYRAPRVLTKADVGHPSGWTNSEDSVINAAQVKFSQKIRGNLRTITGLADYYPDLTGFLIYVREELNDQELEKILIILSAGIEDSERIDYETLNATGPETIIVDLVQVEGLPDLTGWKVIKVGLTHGIGHQKSNLYNKLWREYFAASNANYKQGISFTQLEGEDNLTLCKEL